MNPYREAQVPEKYLVKRWSNPFSRLFAKVRSFFRNFFGDSKSNLDPKEIYKDICKVNDEIVVRQAHDEFVAWRARRAIEYRNGV